MTSAVLHVDGRRVKTQGGDRRRCRLRGHASRSRARLRRRGGPLEQRQVGACREVTLSSLRSSSPDSRSRAAAGRSATRGTATLWVTRDRGAVVMLDAKVPAGQTLMRALRSKAKVETRYGGRFVQAIDGVEGSLSKRHDWFWFVNGLAGDRSAAEYRLRAGDVVWWDYRDWTHDADLAGRRRRVPGAVPPRLRRQGASGSPSSTRCGSQREDARRGRAPAPRDVGRACMGSRCRRLERVRARPGDRHAVHRPAAQDRRAVEPGRADVLRRRRQAARRRVHAEVLGPVSPGAGTALLGRGGRCALVTSTALGGRGDRRGAARRVPARTRPGGGGRTCSAALTSGLGVFVLSPFLWSSGGGTLLWDGPDDPRARACSTSRRTRSTSPRSTRLRLAAVGLAFAAYALLLDHDRLVTGARFARRSASRSRSRPGSCRRSSATPRDCARRCGERRRAVGARGYAMLLSPLVAGSLERASSSRRGDGGARLRPPGRDTDAATVVDGAWTGPRSSLGLPCSWGWPYGSASAGRAGSRSRTRCRVGVPRRLARDRAKARWWRCSGRRARASRRSCVRSPGSCRTSTADVLPAGSRSRGLDTRLARPADLAGTVATVFQDPEDQVVMGRVLNEVAFGLENIGVPAAEIAASRRRPRSAQVGVAHLAERRTATLSGGELQRVCLASALALRAASPAAGRADVAARSGRRGRVPRRRRGARLRRACSRSTASTGRSRLPTACSSSRKVAWCSTRRATTRGTGSREPSALRGFRRTIWTRPR